MILPLIALLPLIPLLPLMSLLPLMPLLSMSHMHTLRRRRRRRLRPVHALAAGIRLVPHVPQLLDVVAFLVGVVAGAVAVGFEAEGGVSAGEDEFVEVAHVWWWWSVCGVVVLGGIGVDGGREGVVRGLAGRVVSLGFLWECSDNVSEEVMVLATWCMCFWQAVRNGVVGCG